jgi:general secretion pathway protein J
MIHRRNVSLRRGLTLAELSIVILLMSILFTIMFSTFFAASRIEENTSPENKDRTAALLALNLIQNSLNQAYYLPELDRLVFYGKAEGTGDSRSDVISFATVFPASAAVGLPAIREVSYYLKRKEPGLSGTLYRREDQNIDRSPYTGGIHYKILDNVESFRLSYSLNGKDWVDHWSSKTSRRFPRLIRIEILVRVGGRTVDGKPAGGHLERFESLASPGLYLY